MVSSLMAISPLDGKYSDKVSELHTVFSEYALIKYRVIVEINWFMYLSQLHDIKELPQYNAEEYQFLQKIIDDFDVEEAQKIKEIEKITNHDVKAVEYYLKEKLQHHDILKKDIEFVHFACTSEDINNLSHALMLKDMRSNVFTPSYQSLRTQFMHVIEKTLSIPMMSRTHGQAATPTTLGKEMVNVLARLDEQYQKIIQIDILGKINGAVGNYNAHHVAYPDINWQSVSLGFIEKLGLSCNLYTTQIEPHDYIAELFHGIARFNNICIDFCRDVWGYISLGYFKQKLKENEVGSSTMPHKINPIDFENAEGNLGLSNAVMLHLSQKLTISRWQRDLSDSTALRNMGVAIGYALLSYKNMCVGMQKLEVNTKKLLLDLNDNWELLSEPAQTVMRKYKINNAYEQLKSLSRGKKLSPESFKQFIQQLHIPDFEKEKLYQLTPTTYIGEAERLATQYIEKPFLY